MVVKDKNLAQDEKQKLVEYKKINKMRKNPLLKL